MKPGAGCVVLRSSTMWVILCDVLGWAYTTVSGVYMTVSTIVYARLDPQAQKILARLQRRTELHDSELIQRALRALDTEPRSERAPQIIKADKFRSNVSNLGSNKTHLQDFGH